MIIDKSASQHDYLECGKTTLRTLEFNLKDGKGRFVPLHNANPYNPKIKNMLKNTTFVHSLMVTSQMIHLKKNFFG